MKNFFGSLILVMLGIAPVPQFAMKVSQIHVAVQIFEIVDCKTDTDSGMTLRGTQKRYCFAGKAIVDETQIESASVWISEYEEKPGLWLKFKPEGASRLHDVSVRLFARAGGPGQLGFVVTGKLVSVATVRDAFSNDLVIANAFDAQECRQLASALNAQAHHSIE